MMEGHAPPEAQHRSLQSSLLFMQQEHAKTLKCLHEEIARLQKKCQDLTFQLAMNTTSTVDEDKYKTQIKNLELELRDKSDGHKSLKDSLVKRDKNIKMLEQQIVLMEKRHADEMKTKAQTLSTMRQEVEDKSNNIAYLTAQLHQMKVKERSSGFNNSRASGVGGRVSPGDSSRGSSSPVSPAPPSSKEYVATRHRRYKPSKTVPGIENSMYSAPVAPPGKGKPGSGRRLPVRAESEESLDPTIFLQVQTYEQNVDIKPVPVAPVLPPISSTGYEAVGTRSNEEISARSFVKRKQMVLPRAEVGQTSSVEMELESLAVDQVNKDGDKMRRTHEYHTRLDG